MIDKSRIYTYLEPNLGQHKSDYMLDILKVLFEHNCDKVKGVFNGEEMQITKDEVVKIIYDTYK